MRRDFAVYLEDIYNACMAVQRYTSGLTRVEFAALDEKQAAVERRFEIMGEALTQCRIHHPPRSVATRRCSRCRQLQELPGS